MAKSKGKKSTFKFKEVAAIVAVDDQGWVRGIIVEDGKEANYDEPMFLTLPTYDVIGSKIYTKKSQAKSYLKEELARQHG